MIITEMGMIKSLINNILMVFVIIGLNACQTISNSTNDLIIEEKLMNSKQEKVFQIAEYLSVNHPYSPFQLTNFLEGDFNIIENSFNHEFFLSPKNPDISNIDSIRLRGYLTEPQILIINLKSSICFSILNLKKIMKDEGYIITSIQPDVVYSRIMDKKNKIGQLHLRLKYSSEEDILCIESIIFDTFENFNKDLYPQPSSNPKV